MPRVSTKSQGRRPRRYEMGTRVKVGLVVDVAEDEELTRLGGFEGDTKYDLVQVLLGGAREGVRKEKP